MPLSESIPLLGGCNVAGYRGVDRRGTLARLADPDAVRRTAWALGLVIVVPLATVGLLRLFAGSALDAASVGAADGALVAFTAAGTVILLRGRLVGEAASGLLGVGALLAVLVVVPTIYAGERVPGYAAALQTTSVLVMLGLFVAALSVPQVWAGARPAVIAIWAVSGALAVAIPLTPVIVVAQRSGDGIGGVRAFEALACAVVAIVLLVRGARARHPVVAATGVALAAVSIGCAAVAAGRLAATPAPAVPPSFFLLMGAVQLLLLSGADLREVVGSVVLSDLRGRRRWTAAEIELSRVRSAYRGSRHDITNMLTAVDGTLLVLARQHQQLTAHDSARLLAAVRSQVQQLRTALSVDRGAARRYDLSELLLGILAVHATAIPSLSARVEPGLEVIGHPDQFTLLIHNLLSNAAIHGRGAAVAVSARRASNIGGDVVAVTVTDHGPGLSDADLQSAFQAGWRGAAAEAVPGTGLGLSQCRQLAEAEGGEITLTHTVSIAGLVGSGLTAQVCLPIMAPAAADTYSILQMRPAPVGEIPDVVMPGRALHPRDGGVG